MKRAYLIGAAGAILVGMALVGRPARKPAQQRPARPAAVRAHRATPRPEPLVARAEGTAPPGAGAVADAALQPLVARWAASDPAAAIDWLARLPDGGAKSRLVATAGLVLAPTDLQAAIEIADALPRGGDRRWLVAGIVRLWAASDPAAAAGWILPLPEGLERNQAIRIVAESWARSDPPSAKQWLETLPAGEGRDLARTAFAGEAETGNPPTP